MTNLDRIRNVNISGVFPFRNADRGKMVSMLTELSELACEECPWIKDIYHCTRWGDRYFCRSQVEAWLDAETADCAECEASGYCAEIDTEYPNCEEIRKEYRGK